ncbi:Uncharacterized ABC transporter ATP-binding protein YbhF [uncultured Clostridium sp.]|uniref:ABC transporter ATP-binding protein n=1 Tax=uncultured Clostridium sp. TaxID=59620 RepID=UPI000820296C|nr:ABC transporter ATP-binding protein [uncultured Clostridium sp.]SCJ93238.1 Uncharacterized ABC transporter ATP-binding protein YbhF [uncultured Clostridium sp.]
MNAIETKNLTKSYVKSRGISDVNLTVKEGEIFGFVGPNGAGKSTTIRTLLNFIFPSSGEAKIFGKDIVKESCEIKKILGYVPSEVKFYDEIKVKDIIKYSSSFYGACRREEIESFCEKLEVDLDKKMGELSLGNKKKVAIVQALIHNPKILILDEPTNGLDPLIQKKLFEILVEQNKKGTTVFLSSHNLVEVENFCHRVAVIKEGKIIDTIEIEKLTKKLGLKVTIEAEGIKKEDIESFNGEVIYVNGKEIIFNYSNGADKLIRELSKFYIDKILIHEQSLEDTFINYYEKEGGR